MSRLRRALNEPPKGEKKRPDIIRTVRGSGYAFTKTAS
jgi:DNA-binding response OmpR family regulator